MLTTSFVAILQSRLRMGRAVIGDVVGRAVSLGLVLLVVGLDLGFYPVLGAAAGGALATLAVTWSLTRGLAQVRPRAQPAVWRALLKSAVPLGLALAINALYFRADTLIISLYEPYDQVGLYTLAYRVLELALVVGTVFLNSTFPVLSEAVAHDPARARRAIESSAEVCVVLGAPLVAGGLVLAPQIIELAGGDDFKDAAEPLRILLAAGALAWINGVFGYALIARDRQASALWLNLSALAFNVGLNFLLIPRYGIVVAAIVTVASELLILVGSYSLMRRYFDFFPVPRTLVPALAAAAAMGGLLWLLDAAPLPVLVAFGGRGLRRPAVAAQPREPGAGHRPAPNLTPLRHSGAVKVGILVVAYNAAGTLAAVLDRIPPDFRSEVDRGRSSATTPARTPPTWSGSATSQTVRPAAHGHPPPAQPRLRRQPEGGLPLRDRARPRHRRAAARRRPVRPGVAARDRRAARARRGRRRVRLAHDEQGRRARGRHAALQVRRQPHPLDVRERRRSGSS